MHRALKVLVAAHGLTITGVVRDLVEDYLEAQGLPPSALVEIEDDLSQVQRYPHGESDPP